MFYNPSYLVLAIIFLGIALAIQIGYFWRTKRKARIPDSNQEDSDQPKAATEFERIFMTPLTIRARSAIYVSGATKQKILEIVRKVGGERMTVTSYAEHILRQHLAQYKEEINRIYEERGKKICFENGLPEFPSRTNCTMASAMVPAAVAQVRRIPGRRAGQHGLFRAGRRVPPGRGTAANRPETLRGYRPSAVSEGHPATCGIKARRCCYICSATGRKAGLDAGLGRVGPPGSNPRERRDRGTAGAPAAVAASVPAGQRRVARSGSTGAAPECRSGRAYPYAGCYGGGAPRD